MEEVKVADVIKQKDEFKNMLEQYGKDYEDFGNGLIIVIGESMINVRQYCSDGFCVSSWVETKKFKEKIGGLLGNGKPGI